MVKKFYEWIKSLPTPLQTLYYALETTVIGGLTILVANYISAITGTPPRPFDWVVEFGTLWLAVKIGLAKGILDLLKSLGGAGPTQTPAP